MLKKGFFKKRVPNNSSPATATKNGMCASEKKLLVVMLSIKKVPICMDLSK
jgi:hypothetical protein